MRTEAERSTSRRQLIAATRPEQLAGFFQLWTTWDQCQNSSARNRQDGLTLGFTEIRGSTRAGWGRRPPVVTNGHESPQRAAVAAKCLRRDAWHLRALRMSQTAIHGHSAARAVRLPAAGASVQAGARSRSRTRPEAQTMTRAIVPAEEGRRTPARQRKSLPRAAREALRRGRQLKGLDVARERPKVAQGPRIRPRVEKLFVSYLAGGLRPPENPRQHWEADGSMQGLLICRFPL